jgi:hypothetical protein
MGLGKLSTPSTPSAAAGETAGDSVFPGELSEGLARQSGDLLFRELAEEPMETLHGMLFKSVEGDAVDVEAVLRTAVPVQRVEQFLFSTSSEFLNIKFQPSVFPLWQTSI